MDSETEQKVRDAIDRLRAAADALNKEADKLDDEADDLEALLNGHAGGRDSLPPSGPGQPSRP